MITTNPFFELSEYISPLAMQIYVIAMFVMVIGGTLIDTIHKKSARYFFENAEKAAKRATREVSSSERTGIAIKTVANEVLTSAEFSNQKRRLSHLLTMYGFIIFVATTAIMIFGYGGSEATPVGLPLLWHLGALMLCVGGYWFWFFIRVDLVSEGKEWYKLARADLFIVSLLMTATFALIWSVSQSISLGGLSMLFFAIFILFSTILFGTVLWSKFAHMFFKPAAAYQKRITQADGSNENLPTETRDDPAQRERHSMELLKDAPMDMGLGIKREEPRHY